MPVATQTTAGTRNAPRQPIHAVSAAVMPAASDDADIAADAVEGERAAAVGRGRDHDRGADRMIDRGEHAEREQRDRERDEIRRQRRRGAAQAAADVEHHHHVAAAPAVSEPARRQREDAEGKERCGAEREQFAIGPAVDHLEADHHGREDQHHVVIDRVGEVVEADGQPPAGFVVEVCALKAPLRCLGNLPVAGRAYSAAPRRSYADFEELMAGSGAVTAESHAQAVFSPMPPTGQILDSTTGARINFSAGGAVRAAHGAGGPRCVTVGVCVAALLLAVAFAQRLPAHWPTIRGDERSGHPHPGRACPARPAPARIRRAAMPAIPRGFCCSPPPIIWRQGGFAHGGVLWAPWVSTAMARCSS